MTIFSRVQRDSICHCRSVGPSVRPSVRRSVRPHLVFLTVFYSFEGHYLGMGNENFQLEYYVNS